MIGLEAFTESQAQEVVQRLVDVIDDGGLEAVAVSSSGPRGIRVVLQKKPLGEAELRQALRRRAKAAWQASWW